MPVRKVRGKPVPGQFPRLVPQAQPFHARHRAESAGDHGVNSLDPLGPQRHRAPMIAEDRGPRNTPTTDHCRNVLSPTVVMSAVRAAAAKRAQPARGCPRCSLQDRAAGRAALIGRMPMSRVGRARERGETQGMMKMLIDAETKKILGAAILGIDGDEVIHSILDVMYTGAPYTVIRRAMHIHPTVTELIPTLVGDLRPLV